MSVHRKVIFLLSIMSIVLAAACQTQKQAAPTEPAATGTPKPAATATFPPTNTPEPTATRTAPPTSTPTPTAAYVEFNPPALRTMRSGSTEVATGYILPREKNDEGGFSFQPPVGIMFDVDGSLVEVFSPDQENRITLVGADTAPTESNPKDFVSRYLKVFFDQSYGKLVLNDGDPVSVDGAKGWLFEIGGKMYNKAVQGHMVVFYLSQTHTVFAYGFASDKNKVEGNPWEKEGRLIFAELVSSLKFYTPRKNQTGAVCPIAHDPTYGLVSEHPIRVGGGDDKGNERQKIYLDNLLGPNGEPTHYFRWGTLTVQSEVVDVYTITYPGVTYLIFLSKHGWFPSLAPTGFTCKGVFKLKDPY